LFPGRFNLRDRSSCAAQRDNQAKQANSHPAKSEKKTISLAGRVGLGGKTIVSDRDSRIWKVVNAEMLSGAEGRQVTLKAYTEAGSSEIRVTVVRLREERTAAKLDDAAFPKVVETVPPFFECCKKLGISLPSFW